MITRKVNAAHLFLFMTKREIIKVKKLSTVATKAMILVDSGQPYMYMIISHIAVTCIRHYTHGAAGRGCHKGR